mgnify:CR=1 FL=1
MKSIHIALAGNPNAGKTSIFNALTGSHQHVGNWPGKTVEKKEGFFLRGDTEFRLVDLPGTYSLSAYSPEEVIATTSGSVPEGMELTWDMFLTPVFRATLGRGYASLYPEIPQKGNIAFISKSQLIDHYVESLGAVHFGGRLMIIDTNAAMRLINKYFTNIV